MPAAAVVHMLLLTTTGGRWLRSSLPSMRRLCKNLLGLHISTD